MSAAKVSDCGKAVSSLSKNFTLVRRSTAATSAKTLKCMEIVERVRSLLTVSPAGLAERGREAVSLFERLLYALVFALVVLAIPALAEAVGSLQGEEIMVTR